MKLGLDSYSTRNSGLDPVGVLEFAAGLGLDGRAVRALAVPLVPR